ncbi:transposase [Olsenella sp. KGMB02461]|nr:transposase [Olsenella sp. KGMB02461]
MKEQVRRAFEAEGGARGYRAVWARLKREGVRVSEKVVRRLMGELGLVARGHKAAQALQLLWRRAFCRSQ